MVPGVTGRKLGCGPAWRSPIFADVARLTAARYLAHIRDESARFRDVVAATPTGTRVPGCPDWDAEDLLWHLAEVQWFWGTVIASRPAGPPQGHPARPLGRRALLDFFDGAMRLEPMLVGLSRRRRSKMFAFDVGGPECCNQAPPPRHMTGSTWKPERSTQDRELDQAWPLPERRV